MKGIKYLFMLVIYVWLRFDLVLRLAFGSKWKPRQDFLISLFGQKDAETFLLHRGKLVKQRNRKMAPIILPKDVEKQTQIFLATSSTSKSGKEERLKILNKLIFWATDSDINKQNIESYKTRCAIIENILHVIFQNSLFEESELILNSLEKIVFSRVTYLGHKGEPSPIVHDVILTGVGRLLTSHYNEVERLSKESLDKLTTIKLIKEIQKHKGETGSLAFSGEHRQDDEYRNKFPLDQSHVKQLLTILNHYRFSAWPESRDRAVSLIEQMDQQLGYSLKDELATLNN